MYSSAAAVMLRVMRQNYANYLPGVQDVSLDAVPAILDDRMSVKLAFIARIADHGPASELKTGILSL